MKRFSAILSLFLLLSGGCSDTGAPDDRDIRDDVPLGLSVSVEGNVATRSVTPLTSGNIGIYLLSGNGYFPGAFSYSATSGSWTTANPILLTAAEASVCVWYPYNYWLPADPDDVQHFPLNAQKYTPEADLCYQAKTGGLNNRNNRLTARLQHAYSQIEFRLSRDITFKTTGVVENITLSARGLRKGLSLNLITGNTVYPVEGNITFEATLTVPESGEAVTTLLLPPATLTSDLSLTFNVDGVEMTAVLPQTSLSPLEAGNTYIVRGVLQRELQITLTMEPTDGTAGGEIIW